MDVINMIEDELNNSTFEQQQTTEKMNWLMYQQIQGACFEIAQKKSSGYGTAPLKLFGGKSILIRMNDKIARLNNIMENADLNKLKDESIDDTLMDLINYATYLIMLRRGGIQ